MDVGMSINIYIPMETSLNPQEIQLGDGGIAGTPALSNDKSPEKYPVIYCADPQEFTLHGLKLEFLEDVANAHLLNSFVSHFEDEIKTSLSEYAALELREMVNSACSHLSTLIRLGSQQAHLLQVLKRDSGLASVV
eukprot:TRINITY_DN2277_c0_g1_i1.p1 TRINITY_DN2277_c0_g1~~TRINITY_DN2277_c0_g1_i1.p1  ORF type:complete len:136 (-),score=21.54 TRINITY_DN2277_c0_g1_i1:74-481(-)